VTTLHIACAADAAYAPHSAAMLHSVLAHRGEADVHIHYLHGPQFPARSARRVRDMVDGGGGAISFHEIADERIAGLPEMVFVTSAMWYRIFLPELLPEVDRVLYLDVDTIAVDSLEPLWEIDLAESHVAAVTNVFYMRSHAQRSVELGIEPADYFNSGVVMMNLDRMRRDSSTQALFDYAVGHAHELAWPDQDALNVVLGKGRVPLHPRWNCMNSILLFPWAGDVFGADAVEEARRRPGIRHFEGPTINKPWHYGCESPMREVYFEHRRQTPWPRSRIEGRTPRNVLRRLGRTLRGRGGASDRVARRVRA
jgi:lipopolysaccharide biosynthesis glycosyltransferase